MLYQSENPHGGDIYTKQIRLDFSASTNPLGIPPEVLNAMRDALLQSEHYPDPYCREAVSAISAAEQVPEDFLLLGNGAAELIYSFCTAARPAKALLMVPSFSEYESALREIGCEVRYHPLSAESDFSPDGSFPEAICYQQPDAVFICSPNNPTGRLVPPDLLNRILDSCGETGARLFLDECFLALSGNRDNLSARLAKYPKLFILKALTKTYALAGVRIGYGMSADSELLQRMSRNVQPWNVSVIAQAAAAAAVRQQEYLVRSIELIRTERAWLTEALSGLGFLVCPSDANFLLFKGPAGLDSSLREAGIAIRNCANFPGLGEGWYRIAVRTHEDNQELIRSARTIVSREVLWQRI